MIQAKDLPPPDDFYPVRRALLSVYDKTNITEFAQSLAAHAVELISTGGTARVLREAGLEVTDVSELTGYPEILGGRVKTMHPAIHGGVLARRNDPDDLDALTQLDIQPIDLIVVNLYPFEEVTAGEDVSDGAAMENIDIGGPTMMRAAAKNHAYIAVASDPGDYAALSVELDENNGGLSARTRRSLAGRAFARTARYEQSIASFFAATDDGTPDEEAGGAPDFPMTLNLRLPRLQTLRYGENPHQQAAVYGDTDNYLKKLHGKDLSFNNLMDASAALALIDEFRDAPPTCAILKHTNPCGVATADDLEKAYQRAFSTDRQSPFGGIVIVNRPLDRMTAVAIDRIFTEIIIAPEFEEGALDLLAKKKNRRLLRSLQPSRRDPEPDVRSISGGLLVQERDPVLPRVEEQKKMFEVVTERAPTEAEWRDLIFGWRVVKHVKSNAIVYVKDQATGGIGAGQMSRIDASELAVHKGRKSELDFQGTVVASDAFFPFADGLVAAAESGARAAIQPGGPIRDDEVIHAADEHDIAMVFTGRRHFRH